MQTELIESAGYTAQQIVNGFSPVMPTILGALAIFLVGFILAKIARNITKKILESINFSKWLKKTPIQAAFEESNFAAKAEEVIANIVYWIAMLLVILATTNALGLESVSYILQTVISYIPRVITASIILFFGILLAGWVESLVKSSVKNVDLTSSILLGKISSYIILAIFILIALSELGIATQFITILFLGFVGGVSIAAALAIGLGSKDIVSRILDDWYTRRFDQESSSKEKTKSKKK